MKRTVPLVALAALGLGGALSACGDSSVRAVAADAAADPIIPTPAYVPDYPGPPQTAQMNCTDKKTCDLVFIPPSKDTVRPFGLPVKLLRADQHQVVISVAGTQHVVGPGKAVQVKGATVTLVGTPGSVVTLTMQTS